MKDLQKLAKECMEELDTIGVPYGYVKVFEVNTRAKSRWGQTKRRDGNYSINISVELLRDSVKDESAKSTIIHELLHTCPNCMNHGSEWQKWAELVNDCYSCYTIKRCSSADEKGIDETEYRKIINSQYLWKIKCPLCNREWKFKRRPTRFGEADNFGVLPYAKCICGCTKIKLIKL